MKILKSIIKDILNLILLMFSGRSDSELTNFRGHEERMESRRRRSMFDRYK